MSLCVTYTGSTGCQETFIDLPGLAPQTVRIEIAVNRSEPGWCLAPGAQEFTAVINGEPYNILIVAPEDVEVHPPEKWGSESPDSGALYLATWKLYKRRSNNPVVVAIQFLPLGSLTSCHYHNLEMYETFHSLDKSGLVTIHTEDTVKRTQDHCLLGNTSIRVGPRVAHQLECMRPENWHAEQFAAQLLVMEGQVTYPDRQDHIRYRSLVEAPP